MACGVAGTRLSPVRLLARRSCSRSLSVTQGESGERRAASRTSTLPSLGASVRSRIVVMPIGRGSSSASATLAEAIRLGTAPRAIILPGVDQILAVGAIVARMLYGRICPILVVDEKDYRAIATGDRLTISKDGSFVVEARRPKLAHSQGAKDDR